MTDFDLQMAAGKLAEAMFPDDEIAQAKANAAVISKDGGVHSRPLMNSLPWYRADVSIPGAVSTGSAIRRVPFPQGGVIKHVSLHAKTPPASQFNFRLVAGSESQTFSLQAGQRAAMSGSTMRVESGTWVLIDITSSGGAADIEMTLHYTAGG